MGVVVGVMVVMSVGVVVVMFVAMRVVMIVVVFVIIVDMNRVMMAIHIVFPRRHDPLIQEGRADDDHYHSGS
jgi:hypothetical protein